MSTASSNTRPNVVVEVKRYDDPDAWFFAHFTKCAYDDFRAEAPIFDGADYDRNEYENLQWYAYRLDGVMTGERAAKERTQLVYDNYTPYRLSEVDVSIARYIHSCVVPIEWQRDLRNGDVDLADRIVVWIGK